jgi:hypothetical protein
MLNVNYEVACEAIGQLIAREVAIIAEEESRAAPDRQRLAAADNARRSLAAARDALAADDENAIALALEAYGPRARRLGV